MKNRQRGRGAPIGLLAVSLLLSCWASSAQAQQTTGERGSPSATAAVDGEYLPAPPPPFGGVINLGAEQSKPFQPPTLVPPHGAPNVLLTMTDDGVSGAFGGNMRF
jgi:hypothetical protein